MTAPKINFCELKGFPELGENGRVETEPFLTAAREIVSVIEKFGKLFSPVIYDMNGNIEKLSKYYVTNTEKHKFIDDMVLSEADNKNNVTRLSLLWLKRALELLEHFFLNVGNATVIEDNLKDHFQAAYRETLQKYHGWILQETFSVIFRWIPKRSDLLGTSEVHDANICAMKQFLPRMSKHLVKVNSFIAEHNLDDNKKA